MKRVLFLSGFLFFSFVVFGQDADSLAATRQVDSLIQVSRELTAKKDFDQALAVNAAAEKIALEKLGRESAAYGSCCFNHGRVLYFKRDYSDAEKWYLESKLIREKALGKEHPDYAWSLNNLAIMYAKMGQYEKAEPLYIESKAIREKALGKEHPDYAKSLNNLASLYWDMGQYEKAEPLYIEAKAIYEKVPGKEHPDYGWSLLDLAGLYENMGQSEKAEPLYIEAKAILEKALGKEHPVYAASLNNLASLYLYMGQYEKAEPLIIEAKAILEIARGKEHPDYATSLNNLALMYANMGQYEKAELLYIESKAIREKALGKEHPDYAKSLNNLASLYWDMGQYEKAEPLYIEPIAILEKVLGKEHPDYAKSLVGLANLYWAMGRYEKTEPLFIEAIAIQEKVLAKEHPDYANSLHNLAGLYADMGQYEKAEPLFIEAKAIREKALGKEHPVYAGSLAGLAALYENMGQYEKAEPLIIESVAIREKALGKEHPDYANSLNNLAYLYRDMGQYEKAEPLYLEAKTIREKVIGKKHPDYGISLLNLGNLYEIQCRFPESEPLLDEYFELMQFRLSQSVNFLSMQELTNYAATYQWGGSFLLSCLFARLAKSGQAGTLSAINYNHALFQKGFLLTTAGRLNALAASSPESEELSNQLKGYRRRLAAEYAKPISERKDMEVLEERANAVEKELARTVAGYVEATRQVKWQEVQSALKEDEAAIEFVHFKIGFPKTTDSTMYAALLLRPGAAQLVFVPLFEEKSLDSLLERNAERNELYVKHLYSLAERGAKPLGKPQKTLYDLLWKPLEKELTGTKTIYYSPSGLLHRLNLAAIPVNLDSVLADRYQLVELGSTRQLVIPTEVKPAANDALLFGGISYDADSTAILTAGSISSTRGELSFAYTDSTLRVGTWNALPFTDREVSGVEKTMKSAGFQTDIYLGYTATEESFKSIGGAGRPSPRVLHIATHGFFFPDPKTTSARFETSAAAEPVFKLSDHPMIRSGLLLAGANHAWATGKPLRPGMEDGILTAYEISQMNLSNTELVVLSACETGLGDIQGNEGVYGLQRAFKIAGAKYLIMSLWQVPDKQTSLLMTTFYKKWLEEKMAIPEAFRAAQKELREAGLDPYQWAGFVLVE